MKPQATTIRPESASPVDTRLFAVRKRWRKVRAVTGRCTPENIKVGGPHSTRFATSVCGAGSMPGSSARACSMSSSRLPSKINSLPRSPGDQGAGRVSRQHPRAISPKHDQSALAGRTLASTEESRGDLNIKTDAVQDQVVRSSSTATNQAARAVKINCASRTNVAGSWLITAQKVTLDAPGPVLLRFVSTKHATLHELDQAYEELEDEYERWRNRGRVAQGAPDPPPHRSGVSSTS
jgi:hypothetical protein